MWIIGLVVIVFLLTRGHRRKHVDVIIVEIKQRDEDAK